MKVEDRLGDDCTVAVEAFTRAPGYVSVLEQVRFDDGFKGGLRNDEPWLMPLILASLLAPASHTATWHVGCQLRRRLPLRV